MFTRVVRLFFVSSGGVFDLDRDDSEELSEE
jgi:hypothetical protein